MTLDNYSDPADLDSDVIGDWEDDTGGDAWLNGLVGSAIAAAERELGAPTSHPLHIVEVPDHTLCVIQVDLHGRKSFQVYAIDDTCWALVALSGLLVDALLAVRRFRAYAALGGTLPEWLKANPDGITPA